jgi:hypothetical protein
VKFCVEAVAGYEFVVGAAFGDDAAGDDHNLIGVADSAETMGDSDDSLSFRQLFER